MNKDMRFGCKVVSVGVSVVAAIVIARELSIAAALSIIAVSFTSQLIFWAEVWFPPELD